MNVLLFSKRFFRFSTRRHRLARTERWLDRWRWEFQFVGKRKIWNCSQALQDRFSFASNRNACQCRCGDHRRKQRNFQKDFQAFFVQRKISAGQMCLGSDSSLHHDGIPRRKAAAMCLLALLNRWGECSLRWRCDAMLPTVGISATSLWQRAD